MKRILITGLRSYIGTSVDRYLQKFNMQNGRELYRIDMISLREEAWENYNFAPYDVIFHVAGIAHVDAGNLTEEQKEKYYTVNRDLTYKVAQKAKEEGVKQFIFMSSIIVFGGVVKAGSERLITKDTLVNPENAYGDSKVQAEKLLNTLQDDKFKVAILRPPMIYGKNSKGNYSLLEKVARYSPVFVDFPNSRSALYVENLAEFIRLLIDSEKGGLYLPQNAEYLATSRMVKMICQTRGKKILLVKWANPLINMLGKMPGRIGEKVNKAFGSLRIDQTLSRQDIDGYQIYSLEESIKQIEKE